MVPYMMISMILERMPIRRDLIIFQADSSALSPQPVNIFILVICDLWLV